MTYKIYLPEFMEECPEYWQNFMNSFHGDPVEIFSTEDVLKQRARINKQLASFNGCYVEEDAESLQFQRKEDATFFILRWS